MAAQAPAPPPETARPAGELAPLLERIRDGVERVRFLPGTDYVAAAEESLADAKRLLAGKVRRELESRHPPVRIVCVMGGTNVGKSSVFNLFLGDRVAGPEETAGATKCPVVLVSEEHRRAVEDESFLPGYEKEPLSDISRANQHHERPTAFVARRKASLPWILVDSPDIDSKLLDNARVGQDLLWLADTLLFVTSDQKYLDRRPLEFFGQARELRKELVVVFNKIEAAETGKIISEDFCQKAGVGPKEIVRVILPYRPGLAPGDEAGQLLDPVREQLAGDPGPAKRRALAGAARYLARRMASVLETFEREQGQVGKVRERLAELAQDARRQFRRLADEMAARQFYELEEAIRRVVEEYRVPYVDDFLVRVREGLSEVWGVLRRQFGKPAEEQPPIEERRKRAFEEALRQVEGAGRSFRQALRARREEGDLFRVLYDRVADLETTDRAALEDAHRAASAGREEFTGRIEEKIRAWLAQHPEKRAWLQAFKLVLRGGVGVLAAFVTGGFGAWDLLIGPAAAMGSELAIQHLAPPNFFREFRDKFVELELFAFEAVLAAGYLAPYGVRLPAPEESASVGRLKTDLEELASHLERKADGH